MDLCKAIHKCARCGDDCKCYTYKWACPWINDDEDKMCEICMDETADEMEEFEKIKPLKDDTDG